MSLARYLICEVQNQLSELLTHCATYHHELEHQCGYDSKEAWLFIGIVVRAMFDFLTIERRAVADLTDLTSREGKAQIIWAVLSVHIKFNQIRDADFKSHQVATTAMSNFIMKTRVNGSSVDQMETKLTAALKTIADSQKKVSSQETQIKELRKECQSQATKISSLEKKKQDK